MSTNFFIICPATRDGFSSVTVADRAPKGAIVHQDWTQICDIAKPCHALPTSLLWHSRSWPNARSVKSPKTKVHQVLMNEDNKGSCIEPNTTPWSCAITDIPACCHSSVAQRSHALSIGTDRMSALLEQYLSLGIETWTSHLRRGRRRS